MIAHLGGKCVGCGTDVDLDVHHVTQREKSHYISRIWSVAMPRLLKELAKCELRCRARCHLETESYGRRIEMIEQDIPF